MQTDFAGEVAASIGGDIICYPVWNKYCREGHCRRRHKRDERSAVDNNSSHFGRTAAFRAQNDRGSLYVCVLCICTRGKSRKRPEVVDCRIVKEGFGDSDTSFAFEIWQLQ